jgi:hypothetical protein
MSARRLVEAATTVPTSNTTSIIYPDIKDAISLPFLARNVMQYIKGGISWSSESFGALSARFMAIALRFYTTG